MNVLIYGDTETSAALRHEVPLPIGDPFLYLESDGRRAVMTNALEDARIARALPDLERLLVDALGRDELIERGLSADRPRPRLRTTPRQYADPDRPLAP